MRWYRTGDSRYRFDFNRKEVAEMWKSIIGAAEHDVEAHNWIAECGLWTTDGQFDWGELWKREEEREQELERQGWAPL